MKISFSFKVWYKLKFFLVGFGGAGNFIRFKNVGLKHLLGPPATSSTVAVHTYKNDGNADKPGCPDCGGGGYPIMTTPMSLSLWLDGSNTSAKVRVEGYLDNAYADLRQHCGLCAI